MTGSGWVDLLLALLTLVFALLGLRQGFVVGAMAVVGFLGGGVVGALAAPPLLRALDLSGAWAVLGLLVVAACALVGQAVFASLGAVAKSTLSWAPARAVDAAAGAALSAVGLLAVAWFVGSVALASPFPQVVSAVRASTLLGAVDRVVPDVARTAFSDLRRSVREADFPPVFGDFDTPLTPEVAPPDPAVAGSAAAAVARESVVRVDGVAPACSRRIEGTGFAYAPGRIMTNAHVVAGTEELTVTTVGGRSATARVVLFDPEDDLAVLAVEGLAAPALPFDGTAEAGQDAVVAGFPQGGPFTLTPARIRAEQQVRGLDVYAEEYVTREVYALRGTVRPGNSGGPLLSTGGAVIGVIFAASAADPATGYALTADEVAEEAAAGRAAGVAVDTGRCV